MKLGGLHPFRRLNEVSKVNVHPVVVLSILDHHLRRPADQKRVMGTLMGQVSMVNGTSIVTINDCFPVPHVEKEDEVAVGKDFNKQMLALHKLSDSKDVMVGWFATTGEPGVQVNTQSCLIHDYYCGEMSNPLHLVVDTTMNSGSIDVTAFVSSSLTLNGKVLAAEFRAVGLELIASEPERISVDLMLKTGASSSSSSSSSSNVSGINAVIPVDNSNNLEISMERLLSMLETINSHVDGIIEGRVPGDPALGRKIADIIARCPRTKPEVYVESFNSSLHDLLMVIYLNNLTRMQVSVAEKISTVL